MRFTRIFKDFLKRFSFLQDMDIFVFSGTIYGIEPRLILSWWEKVGNLSKGFRDMFLREICANLGNSFRIYAK